MGSRARRRDREQNALPARPRATLGHASVEDLKAAAMAGLMEQHRLAESAARSVDTFVIACRRSGCTWAEIAQVLGVSPQAVHRKYRDQDATR